MPAAVIALYASICLMNRVLVRPFWNDRSGATVLERPFWNDRFGATVLERQMAAILDHSRHRPAWRCRR
jgi:hypothetical protein